MVKRAVFLVGHQYSGKSTWLRNQTYKDYVVYSLDSVVHELAKERGVSYSEAWSKLVGEANHILDRRLRDWLYEGKRIIFDRTNMTVKSRSKLLNRLIQEGYKVSAVVFPLLSSEEIQKRIDMRPDQIVPLHIVEEFRDRFEPIEGEELKKYEMVFHV